MHDVFLVAQISHYRTIIQLVSQLWSCWLLYLKLIPFSCSRYDISIVIFIIRSYGVFDEAGVMSLGFNGRLFVVRIIILVVCQLFLVHFYVLFLIIADTRGIQSIKRVILVDILVLPKPLSLILL